MVFGIVFGLALIATGVGTVIFRKRYLQWQKRMLARSTLSPRLKPNPSDRFLEVNGAIGSVFFVAFGVLTIVVAIF